MDSLPPIPTPFSQLWREIRIRLLPVATFAVVIAALFLMWHEYVMPASIIGEAEVIQANIVAKEDGVLTTLAVDRFDNVTRDQVVGVLTPMEKDLQDANLAAIESDLRVLKNRMDLDKIRNQGDYMQKKAALLMQQEELSDLKVQFENAELQFKAQEKLFNEGSSNIISLAQLAIYRRDRDKFKLGIDNKKEVIGQYEKDIKEMEKNGVPLIPLQEATIEKDLLAKQAQLRALTKPVDLKVPIDGKISTILKRAGERVTKGEAIMTVSAPTTDRVIGYIRQPINRLPTTNDVAQIRTRTQRRVVLEGHIIHVGPSMVPLEPAMLAPDVRRREVGLPILISLPQGAPPLVPGEFVDICIQYAKK
jgi:multidrug resistance efflux pump